MTTSPFRNRHAGKCRTYRTFVYVRDQTTRLARQLTASPGPPRTD